MLKELIKEYKQEASVLGNPFENDSDSSLDYMQNPQPSTSNLLKALKEAISEFVDDSPDEKIKIQNKNKRIICIFTSKFNLSNEESREVYKIVRTMHKLKINIVIFGYEIGHHYDEEESYVNPFRTS